MALYLAMQIEKGNLTYAKVMTKFSNLKDDIDTILIADGYGHLIVE